MRIFLKQHRKMLNLTQEDIAQKLGISRSTYANIEVGRRNPSYQLSLKIKQVIGYSADDLFNVDNADNIQRIG